MAKFLVVLLSLTSFVGLQVLANPFGPSLPNPQPLPTQPAPGTGNPNSGNNGGQPGLPVNPINPGVPIGRGGNPSPTNPSPGSNPSLPNNPGSPNYPNYPNNPGYPTNPGSNPYYPNNPSNPYPNYPGAGLINLNYACPLVDQENNADLLMALDALERAIQIVPECRNDANLANSSKMQDQMRNSANELRRLWNDPDHLDENLVQFDSQLQTMLLGINYFSETLNNNSLLNSRCGREMMTTGTAMMALADLITGMAPFAMVAAAAATSMKTAVPFVVGVVGISSIIKLVTQLASNKTFDMNRYEHRQTVLKAVCEYSRMATKIRYIKLAQSGQVDMLTREIRQLDEAMFYDQAATGGKLEEILKERQEFYHQVDGIRAQMYEDVRSQNELRKYLLRLNDDSMACALGIEILENHKSGKFPLSIDKNFKFLMSISMPHNELTLKATARQYDVAIGDLESNVTNANGYRMGYCGQVTQRFIGTLDRILQTIEEELVAQERLYENKLSENPIYKSWYSHTSGLEKDRETLKRVVKTMEKTGQDSSVMSKSELHQRMESLRNTLFGSQGGWITSKSPVEAWLTHTYNMHSRAISLFNQSVASLMKDVGQMRLSQPRKTVRYDETISILPDGILREWIFVDVNEENFRFINTSHFPAGSPQQEVLCQRLEEVWLNWAAALDHLMAMKHFCANIATFIDNKTSAGVVNYCGQRSIDGSEPTSAVAYQTEGMLASKGFRGLAITTSRKMAELKCVGH